MKSKYIIISFVGLATILILILLFSGQRANSDVKNINGYSIVIPSLGINAPIIYVNSLEESDIEKDIVVTTVHKSKGKEYENVNMQLNSWMKSLRSRI